VSAHRAGTLAEAAAALKRRAGGRPSGLPAAFFVTDPSRTPDPLAAARGLPAGVGVLFRPYGLAGAEATARRLAALCRRERRVLLVAGDFRLALRCGAAGLHLPERLLWAGVPRRPRRGWLLTAAAHGRPALVAARRGGVDAALLSPVFPTASHAGAPDLGPLRFAALTRRAGLPVLALGGVVAGNVHRLAGSGAAGIAAIGGLRDDTPG